ncbi:MAG: hypothetical protein HC824_11955 [Synechococcales cyanobacterium RM1_1_8]|nr:hypothetical protein [Synechococcales cyanobacterium RM1_1_8]
MTPPIPCGIGGFLLFVGLGDGAITRGSWAGRCELRGCCELRSLTAAGGSPWGLSGQCFSATAVSG